MGQYRQWLHHQELDQQLRTRLEQLEQELADLQSQVRLIEDAAANKDITENIIIQALLRQQKAEEPPVEQPDTQEMAEVSAEQLSSNGVLAELVPTAISKTLPSPPPSTPVSLALFAWSRLPNFDSQQVPPSYHGLSEQTPPPITPPPSMMHPEENLLPNDMAIFFEKQSQVSPPRQLPPWLESAISTATSQGPIDQQAQRTNRLIQRWLERWGRSPHDQQTQREDQHP